MQRFFCGNPNCAKPLHETTVEVQRKDLWRCGDHDERVLTTALITCSWTCLAAVAHDLGASDDARVREAF